MYYVKTRKERTLTKMKKVLHIVGTMNLGGQEAFIMNLYRNIDRSKVQFDFVVHSKEEGAYEEEIKKLGGKIYRITPISKNVVKHCTEMKKILKNESYVAIHRHTSTALVAIDLIIAKFLGVKKRIAHSHNTSTENAKIHKMFRPILNATVNIKLACGEEAGEWLFGKRQEFIIVNNGIDIEKYKFNEKIRNDEIKKLNLDNAKVIGHIGRFSKQKNHDFLIDMFNEIIKKDKHFSLLLIGDGELKEKIQRKVKELNIEKNVKFLGARKDVNKILNAIDIIAFPSLYEGLPVTLIEAQTNGIPIIMSNTISNKVIYNDNILVENLENKETWVEKIVGNELKRTKISNKLIQEYDIKKIAKKMEKIYLE